MKREIARIIFEEIETDETGKYCGKIPYSKHCRSLIASSYNEKIELRFYCLKFPDKGYKEKRLTIENNKPSRCRACLGAEIRAQEVNE